MVIFVLFSYDSLSPRDDVFGGLFSQIFLFYFQAVTQTIHHRAHRIIEYTNASSLMKKKVWKSCLVENMSLFVFPGCT